MTADILANRQTGLLNIFRHKLYSFTQIIIVH